MILHGDCLELMRDMEPNSVDAIVTDPPYGLTNRVPDVKKCRDCNRVLGGADGKPDRCPRCGGELYNQRSQAKGGGFMGKDWDGTGIELDPATWEACLRVLKPGGHLVAFSGTRTSHRMICAIEDAGFEIRDSLVWMFGSGFPKSLDVSKAIDKAAGAEREVIGVSSVTGARAGSVIDDGNGYTPGRSFQNKESVTNFITAPATPEAEQWQGWGTALKPGHEPICLARKPIAASTVAANVLAYGTGAINVDACRIGTTEKVTNHSRGAESARSKGIYGDSSAQDTHQTTGQQIGRWPANVILDETAAGLLDAMSGERKAGVAVGGKGNAASIYGTKLNKVNAENQGYGDTGGASRFFLTAPIDDPDAEHLRFITKNPNVSDDFMVQYDCNCETTEGGKWEKQDHQASTQAASDTPPKRDTTASTSGTGNEAALSWPTSLNGNSTTDLSPTVSRFITATATSKTTASRTCNCSTHSHTSVFTRDANCATANGGSPAACAANSSPSPSSTGISAERDGRSTGDAVPAISEKSLLINSGDVTRFAYVPKASRAERSAGLTTPSIHPTVKPLALMSWLVRLVTPPGGTVLDPFTGSGSTGCAAALEGFDFIGIEQDLDYCSIARARIDYWTPKDAPQLALAFEVMAGD